ncbi:MAG: DUF2974 domain-containing protein [Coriobacteriales bacterium]|nr:DUF2974 domain-containing protein [Coriobacteriales bacterium]
MANIIEYVRRTSDTFIARPFTRVDGLVLSWLSYLRFPEELPETQTALGLMLAQIGNCSSLLGLVAPAHNPDSCEELLRACAISPRFSLVRVCRTVEEGSVEKQEQFAATTFILPGIDEAFIGFRGTDDTLLGWKESFNLGFSKAVPAQTAARDYVERVARETDCPLWIGGHSKGGNLATFATMTANSATRARIKACFAYDAPGFSKAAMQSGEFNSDWSLIKNTIPQESLVGMLLNSEAPEPCITRTTHPGIMQHSPFYWVIEGNDFATVDSITYDAYRRNKRLNAWINSMSAQQIERFTGVLYRITRATGEVTLSGLIAGMGNGSLEFMLRSLDGLPAQDRQFFTNQLEELAATMLLGPAPVEPKTTAERADHASERVADATAKFNDTLSRLDKYRY